MEMNMKLSIEMIVVREGDAKINPAVHARLKEINALMDSRKWFSKDKDEDRKLQVEWKALAKEAKSLQRRLFV